MPADATETEPAAAYIDMLEAAHDLGGHIVALAEHHAAKLLRDVLARPASAERDEHLERLREIIYPAEYDAIVAAHAAPDGRADGAGRGGFSGPGAERAD